MEILDRIQGIVKPQYDTLDCWIHSWPHVERVSTNAEKVAKLEKIDYVPCVISAYCHDLGRIEEENRKKRGDSPLPHALLSIEPTVKVLQEVGISGVDFNEIVEAVTVHSYRVYEGKNDIARVLQDADKMNGFGPYGILGAVKYFGGVDYVNPEEIQNNRNNLERLREFCEDSLKQTSGEVLERTIKGLGFVLEWFDMFHTNSAQSLMQREYEYTKKIRDSLL